MFNINDRTYRPFADGRYYMAFVESDLGITKLVNGDIEGMEIVGDSIVLPADFHVIDYLIEFNSVPGSAPVDFWKGITVQADGRQAVHIPEGTAFDWANVYIYGRIN